MWLFGGKKCLANLDYIGLVYIREQKSWHTVRGYEHHSECLHYLTWNFVYFFFLEQFLGRVIIFTSLNKNFIYERITEVVKFYVFTIYISGWKSRMKIDILTSSEVIHGPRNDDWHAGTGALYNESEWSVSPYTEKVAQTENVTNYFEVLKKSSNLVESSLCCCD